MYDQSFVDYMQSLLAKYDLEPWMLRIEITESAYMDNPAQLVKVLKKLKNAGFTVLMDDFGSGYSSLNILKDLTVDVLKLDMKFIQNFERSSRASIIMESVVQMAHNLGIDTVVEGVETETQVEFLKEIGCNVVQGYYYAKPMSTEACLDLLINEQ